MAGLVALGTFIAALVAGAILSATGGWFLGLMIAVASVPFALVAWIKMKERE